MVTTRMQLKVWLVTLLGTLALVLSGVQQASAQPWFGDKAQREFSKALTDATRFGVPRYTTALLPTCNTANKGAVAYDTTASSLKVCSGTSWGAVGGGGLGTPSAQTGLTYTTTSTDTFITNTGNAGSLAVTLVNDPTAGTAQLICVTAAQSVSVAPNTGESMYFNGSTASSVSSSTVGSCVHVVAATGGSGAIWIVDYYSGPIS